MFNVEVSEVNLETNRSLVIISGAYTERNCVVKAIYSKMAFGDEETDERNQMRGSK